MSGGEYSFRRQAIRSSPGVGLRWTLWFRRLTRNGQCAALRETPDPTGGRRSARAVRQSARSGLDPADSAQRRVRARADRNRRGGDGEARLIRQKARAASRGPLAIRGLVHGATRPRSIDRTGIKFDAMRDPSQPPDPFASTMLAGDAPKAHFWFSRVLLVQALARRCHQDENRAAGALIAASVHGQARLRPAHGKAMHASPRRRAT